MTSPRMNSPTLGLLLAIANASTTSTCPAGTVDNPSTGTTETPAGSSITTRQQLGLHGLGAMGQCDATFAST